MWRKEEDTYFYMKSNIFYCFDNCGDYCVHFSEMLINLVDSIIIRGPQ